MSNRSTTKQSARARRHARSRARLSGTAERPRLHVFRSLRGLYVQLIDDAAGRTLVSASSRTNQVAAAKALGLALAEKAKAAKITTVVFDRAGHKYHGRVKAVADGARAGGLVF